MVLSYSYCNVSILPLKKEPSHRSEQTSQMLFGEKAEILEIDNGDWARIRTEWDNYEGWCRAGQLTTIGKKEYRKTVKYISGSNSDKFVFEQSEMWVPLGSDLIETKLILGNETGKFKGKKLKNVELTCTCENLKDAALKFMHAPYLWGGRSNAGIDCSGLMQMAFKLCGKKLPRDAYQQANEGKMVDFLQHGQCGDLAFFDNEDGKIIHVGMLLDNQNILHATGATGRVVIDRIDQGGIISTSLRKRTHNLRLVKRYL
ncbi:MAG TPA: C40 family peptidase [Flavipsychrobacter sp.]|nr:C40 family peptidase [Flavipsychrobacter sp.]